VGHAADRDSQTGVERRFENLKIMAHKATDLDVESATRSERERSKHCVAEHHLTTDLTCTQLSTRLPVVPVGQMI
jgi:hypothetical protein